MLLWLCREPGGAPGHALVLLQRRHPGGHAGLGPSSGPGRRDGAGGHAQQVWNQQPPGTARPEPEENALSMRIHQTHAQQAHETNNQRHTPDVQQIY